MSESEHTTVTRGPNGEILVAVKQTVREALDLARQGFTAQQATDLAKLKRKAEEQDEGRLDDDAQ